MKKQNIILSLIILLSVTALTSFQVLTCKPKTFESCIANLNGGTDADCEACEYLLNSK